MEILGNSLHQTSSPGSNKLNLVKLFSNLKNLSVFDHFVGLVLKGLGTPHFPRTHSVAASMGLMKHCSILRAQIFAAINIRETYVSEIYFCDFVTKM